MSISHTRASLAAGAPGVNCSCANMDEEEEQLYKKKYQTWIREREIKAIKNGREIVSLLKNTNRIARISTRFIRTIKNKFRQKDSLGSLIPTLKMRLIGPI